MRWSVTWQRHDREERSKHMVKFRFTVKDPSGLSPKLAGELVKEAIKCTSKVTIQKEEKSGNAKLIFHVLSLSIKKGEKVEVMVEGEKEQEDAAVLEKFIRENLS